MKKGSSFYGGGYNSFYGNIDSYGDINNLYEYKELGPLPIVSFNDAIKNSKIKELIVAAQPQQDLHGYDNPWPAGGGVNAWDEVTELGGLSTLTGEPYNDNSLLRSKNFFPVTPGTDYYFVSPESLQICFYDSNKDFVGVMYGKQSKTVPATAYYGKLQFSAVYGTTYNHDVSVNYPATITTYRPYSNVCPITGRTGAKVERCGKNLLSTDPYTGLDYNKPVGTVVSLSDGGEIVVNNNVVSYSVGVWGYRDFKTIPLKGGTYYWHFSVESSVSGSFRGTIYIIENNGENDIVKYAVSMNSNNGEKGGTITVDDGDYIILQLGANASSTLTFTNLQIEVGSSYTSWEQYIAPTTLNISWQTEAGTVYGGTLDVTNGVLTVDAELEVFDRIDSTSVNSQINSYSFEGGSAQTVGDVTRISFNVRDNADQSKYNRLSSSYTHKMCNYAKHYFSYNDSTVHWYRNTVLYVFLPTALVGSTSQSVYDYLVSIKDTAPLSLWIPLATPQTYQLTPVQLSTLLGENHVWADTGNITLTYKAKK